MNHKLLPPQFVTSLLQVLATRCSYSEVYLLRMRMLGVSFKLHFQCEQSELSGVVVGCFVCRRLSRSQDQGRRTNQMNQKPLGCENSF